MKSNKNIQLLSLLQGCVPPHRGTSTLYQVLLFYCLLSAIAVGVTRYTTSTTLLLAPKQHAALGTLAALLVGVLWPCAVLFLLTRKHLGKEYTRLYAQSTFLQAMSKPQRIAFVLATPLALEPLRAACAVLLSRHSGVSILPSAALLSLLLLLYYFFSLKPYTGKVRLVVAILWSLQSFFLLSLFALQEGLFAMLLASALWLCLASTYVLYDQNQSSPQVSTGISIKKRLFEICSASIKLSKQRRDP